MLDWLLFMTSKEIIPDTKKIDFFHFFLFSVSFSEIHLFQIRQHTPSRWFRPFLCFNVIVGNQLGHFQFYFLWDFETGIPSNLLNNKNWQTVGQRENSGACLSQVLPAHGHTHLCKDCPQLTSALGSWIKELGDLLNQKAKLNLPALALKKENFNCSWNVLSLLHLLFQLPYLSFCIVLTILQRDCPHILLSKFSWRHLGDCEIHSQIVIWISADW